MAEPEVQAAWRAEFKRIGEEQLRDVLNSGVGFADEPKGRQRFVGWVMKQKRGGSGRSKPTIMSGRPSSPLSLS